MQPQVIALMGKIELTRDRRRPRTTVAPLFRDLPLLYS